MGFKKKIPAFSLKLSGVYYGNTTAGWWFGTIDVHIFRGVAQPPTSNFLRYLNDSSHGYLPGTLDEEPNNDTGELKKK